MHVCLGNRFSRFCGLRIASGLLSLLESLVMYIDTCWVSSVLRGNQKGVQPQNAQASPGLLYESLGAMLPMVTNALSSSAYRLLPMVR